ncbi:hypothetical protein SISSUDRAFT_534588 [Sistotremastrum suecicum HHB10207 ss-3]|uniref:Uncharacterized protein n=1 Tax=Sistotremastrum suecicum HHB10207 ss-3 TaxID=1314776 RepID=A0A165XSV4_9AGAM|nr:hypothetical protein SISSUDRAFT_534588 [Sistotremastrum suecicum HHB10207 ss-3]
MTRGLVGVKDGEESFAACVQVINSSVSVLGPAVYTPEMSFSRSPFLFTVICATTSRFMPHHHRLIEHSCLIPRSPTSMSATAKKLTWGSSTSPSSPSATHSTSQTLLVKAQLNSLKPYVIKS